MTDTLDYIANKYALNLHQTSPIMVPGFSRYDLAALFGELGMNYGVELGVQGGRYAHILCKANPNLAYIGIDPYLEYDGIGIPGEQSGQDAGYENTLAHLPPNATLVRKKSHDASFDYPDESFDFVYVDGNHVFSYVADDLHCWIRKVRPGGIIAGHDYRRYYPSSMIHVFWVINAWTEAYKVRPWFTTDPSTEHVRSFFWVKE